METLTSELARWIVRERDSRPSETAARLAQMSIIDTIACGLAAVDEPSPWGLNELIITGEDMPCSLLGMGVGALPRDAAFVNGMLVHFLDFDDGDSMGGGHPSCTVVAALLPVAEQLRASGEDFIRAYLTGYHVFQLLGQLGGKPYKSRGYHLTGTSGALTATAALCSLMKLDVPQTVTALGIAGTTAAGLRCCLGTDMKPFHSANASARAVDAVFLARIGISASQDVLGAEGGFLWVLSDPDRLKVAEQEMARFLSRDYSIETAPPLIKLYACCHASHAHIEALLKMRPKLIGRLDAIERITAEAPHMAGDFLVYPEAVTGMEAKFSMQASLAIALLDGRGGAREFTDQSVQRPEVRELAKKVSMETTDRMQEIFLSRALPGRITVTIDGETFEDEILDPRGCRGNPCEMVDIREKFRTSAEGVLPDDNITAILTQLEGLRTIPDVADVFSRLRGPRRGKLFDGVGLM